MEAEHLDRLAKLGCDFSLDQVRDYDLDAKALADRNVRYVKLPDSAILSNAGNGADAPADLKKRLDSFGIDLIVEKVESEETLVELLEYGIDFGQGYLFGEPRPARPVT